MGGCLTKDNKIKRQITTHSDHGKIDKLQQHEAKIFMVCCMDFRFVDDHKNAMNQLGFGVNYDQYVIAGGSLGFICKDFEHWGQAAQDHLRIGVALHHPIEVLFFDHKDCGFYKKMFPGVTEVDMMKHHQNSMQQAHDILKKNFKTLKFEGFIMNLDGSFDKIIVDDQNKEYEEKNLDRRLLTLHE